MLKIRRSLGRLIFNMGIAIPGKTVFLIETAPRSAESVNHKMTKHPPWAQRCSWCSWGWNQTLLSLIQLEFSRHFTYNYIWFEYRWIISYIYQSTLYQYAQQKKQQRQADNCVRTHLLPRSIRFIRDLGLSIRVRARTQSKQVNWCFVFTRSGLVWYFLDMSGWTSGLIYSGEVRFFPDIDRGTSGGDFENYAEPTTHVFRCF